MKWIKYTIKTLNDATDIVSSVLFDNGIVGVEIDDTLSLSTEDLKAMYVDIPVVKENTGMARVNFYVSIDDDKVESDASDVVTDRYDNSYIESKDNIFTSKEFEKILCDIKSELSSYRDFMDMGSLDISTEILDSDIFLNKWKENFKAFDIDDIKVVPSWDKGKVSSDKNIYIEPGSAFGTGKHTTTRLCIKAIRKILTSFRAGSLLDIGCGSGILAIVGKKCGIDKILAIDIDSSIKDNLSENILLNFTDKKFSSDKLPTSDEISKCKKIIDFSFGNILDDEAFYDSIKKDKYDIVVANILAPVIISLISKAKVYELINDNGYFICSGIISEMESDVVKAIHDTHMFSDVEVIREDNWVAIVAKRSAND